MEPHADQAVKALEPSSHEPKIRSSIRSGSVADLRGFRSFDQRVILEGIERHLTTQPTHVSRSRIKAMVQPFWCQYRLRFDEFRVYYDVNDEAWRVNVLRILKKGRQTTPEDAP